MLAHLEDGSIEFIHVLELKEFTETWPDDQTDLLDQDQLLPGLMAHLSFYNSFIDDWETFQDQTRMGKVEKVEKVRKIMGGYKEKESMFKLQATEDTLTDEDQEEMAGQLDHAGFTDKMDASTIISLFEYGIVRNPETSQTLMAMADYREGLEPNNFRFSSDVITMKDVQDALNEAGKGFYDFLGSTKEKEMANLDNDNLSGLIFSLNQWNGYFRN